MTGNTLTMNPITGTTAYANGAYGATQPGFLGNVGTFGGYTPSVFGTPAFQPQVPMTPLNPFTAQLIQSQPGFVGQPGFIVPTMSPGLTGFHNPQVTSQAILNAALQTTPPHVVNTILQTTPPQVLPYILNALACQQACQQVLAQNPQAVQAINPLTVPGITPQLINQPFLGMTNPAQYGYGSTIGGLGFNTTPVWGGYQGQMAPQFLQQPGSGVGCAPGMQQWAPGVVGFQAGFGQVLPQQPWFNPTYGTW